MFTNGFKHVIHRGVCSNKRHDNELYYLASWILAFYKRTNFFKFFSFNHFQMMTPRFFPLNSGSPSPPPPPWRSFHTEFKLILKKGHRHLYLSTQAEKFVWNGNKNVWKSCNFFVQEVLSGLNKITYDKKDLCIREYF